MAGRQRNWSARELEDNFESFAAEVFPGLRVAMYRMWRERHICVSRNDRWCTIHPVRRIYPIPRRSGAVPAESDFEVRLHEGTPPAAEGLVENFGAYMDMCDAARTSRTADGVTDDPNDVLICVGAWVEEGLPLATVYVRADFIDRNRRALARLAWDIDRAQRAAGSSNLTTTTGTSSGNDAVAGLHMDAGDRSCYLALGQDERIDCIFEIDGIRLASAKLPDPDAAAKAVNLWLDKRLTLDHLSEEVSICVLSRHTELLERGDKTRWNWLNLLERCRGEPYFARHVPLLERFMQVPEISRFTPHTSMDRVRFLRCEYATSSLDGMPVIKPTQTGFIATCDNDAIEGDIEIITPFVARCLERIPDPPCVGCPGVLLLEPINACLAERGSALRVGQTQGWDQCELRVRKGNRICEFETTYRVDEPYRVIFSNEVSSEACGLFKTIPDVATAMEMWLQQGCEPKDIGAIAERVCEVW